MVISISRLADRLQLIIGGARLPIMLLVTQG